MKTNWDPKAKDSLRQIARYINAKFGKKARVDFMQKVKDTELLLRRSPNVGQIDPLFDGRTIAYRSVVINGLNKMVYQGNEVPEGGVKVPIQNLKVLVDEGEKLAVIVYQNLSS